MTYKQGIPTEPGLYWYRETLSNRAYLVFVENESMAFVRDAVELLNVMFVDARDGWYCPAIPPEVNDE